MPCVERHILGCVPTFTAQIWVLKQTLLRTSNKMSHFLRSYCNSQCYCSFRFPCLFLARLCLLALIGSLSETAGEYSLTLVLMIYIASMLAYIRKHHLCSSQHRASASTTIRAPFATLSMSELRANMDMENCSLFHTFNFLAKITVCEIQPQWTSAIIATSRSHPHGKWERFTTAQ